MTERKFRPAWPAATWSVLAVTLALRSLLVVRGGQQFWPDEDRFEFSRTAASDLLGGHLMAAARVVFGTADHVLFRLCAIVPASAEHVFNSGPWLPGLFFAAVSTAMIWATGLLARAAGGDERERFFTVLAAASSASLFYYSRHFVPYDLSLLFFLVALSRAMRPGRDLWSCTCVGLWTACGFLSYNGILDACSGRGGALPGHCSRREVLRGFCSGLRRRLPGSECRGDRDRKVPRC